VILQILVLEKSVGASNLVQVFRLAIIASSLFMSTSSGISYDFF
jgi:hypothetical protein